MSGIEHYREAERLLKIPGLGNGDDPRDTIIVAEAQVHATLALAAALGADTEPEQPPEPWAAQV